ncbi:MAG: 50S ribosomal protein L10 [Candidatus Spechtbacteria bacterium]|nr:50S ribosomal protein L10 [Candidatus Spechtbacteria bacterium]
MAVSRKKKEESLTKFVDSLKKSKIVVFVNFQGMNVKDVSELRNQIRQNGGAMQVVKKTLIKRASQEKGITVDTAMLGGEIAAVFGYDDEVGVVKTLDAAAKGKERPEFRGGIMGMEALNAVMVKQLASIPSRIQLLSQFVGGINAPVSGFVQVLSGNLRNFVQVMHAIHEKKS